MARKPAKRGLTGIEPSEMSVPAMDRPSIAFAWFLDRMLIETTDDDHRPMLVCELCGRGICLIDSGDNLRVLLNTALAHTC